MIAPSTPGLRCSLDYVALLDRALLDDDLTHAARDMWRSIGVDVMARNHERTPGALRTSDAGRCARELWAEVHDKRDLSENPEDLLLKMNQGTLSGAWQACLIAAALQADGYGVMLEPELIVQGEPMRTGHADIVVYAKDTPKTSRAGFAGYESAALEVVDCKWTSWQGEIDPPDVKSRYQCFSTASYAKEFFAPTFVILTSAPSSRKEKRKQFRYDTSEWLFDVEMEYGRLATAFGDAMPEGDPQEAWRCKKCRFGACNQNKNPLKGTAWKAK